MRSYTYVWSLRRMNIRFLYVALLILSAFFAYTVQKDSASVDNGTKNDEVKGKAGTKSYHILMVTFCLRGHFNPASGVTRALIEAGHKVTVILTDSCPELVPKFMPGVTDYHIRPVVPNINIPGGPFEALKVFDEFFRINSTINMFDSLDDFITSSDHKYDLIYGDLLTCGVVIAGRKHNIPVVSQFMGLLLPTAGRYPSLFEKTELAKEDPSEPPSILSIIGNTLFVSMFEVAVSRHLYYSLQEIHAEQGWEPPTYGYGRFPFSYIHRYSILINHGAPPLTRPPEDNFENTISIGFVPDDVMYPPLSVELSDWLDKADGPVVFISLGTVTALTQQESQTMFDQLMSQQKFYFIWAITAPMVKALNMNNIPFYADRLVIGRYLPQGTILQHPKLKVFVTHCGANSILDTIHATKPVISFPGFGDQPLMSNLLVTKRVAKLLKTFTYNDMEPLLEELLSEPNYSQMMERLEAIKREQVKHGGYAHGVRVIEDVIEGKIAVNRSVADQDIMGYPLGEMILIWSMVALVMILTLLGVLYGFYRLICLCFACSKPKKPVEKTD